jgi:hypothetical protein
VQRSGARRGQEQALRRVRRLDQRHRREPSLRQECAVAIDGHPAAVTSEPERVDVGAGHAHARGGFEGVDEEIADVEERHLHVAYGL